MWGMVSEYVRRSLMEVVGTMSQSLPNEPAKSPHGKRIVKRFIRNGREYQLHATKGWRSYRVAPLKDGPTLKRAFGPEGIRPVHEQAEMIRAEGKVTRHGAITVLKDEVALKIGNQKIKPEELKGPLLALGCTLDLTRSSGKNSA